MIINDLSISKANPEMLLAGFSQNLPSELFPYAGIWESTDGGRSWKPSNEGLSDTIGVSEIVRANVSNAEFIYATPPQGPGVYYRLGGESAWRKIGNDALPISSGGDMKITANGSAIYLGSRGVFRLSLQ